MVVNNDEWSSGRGKDTIKNQICESLRRNYPNALTMNEVFNDIGLEFDWEKHSFVSFLGTWGLSGAFDELVEKGEIESRLIEGKGLNYRYKK